ncbi:hypothetical protein TNIN_481681 [Trichonephila inaurata madagascariensis]|uniref:Uncharacterized protein n=1 Tax=Trichonephila inaurata madagascariensis TaxID=2747483 RepID=A0A8X7BRY4_9ARAC|nr:hypothetical protein TNIN_481681 [Trichonephila inaurata madagascariensis]
MTQFVSHIPVDVQVTRPVRPHHIEIKDHHHKQTSSNKRSQPFWAFAVDALSLKRFKSIDCHDQPGITLFPRNQLKAPKAPSFVTRKLSKLYA